MTVSRRTFLKTSLTASGALIVAFSGDSLVAPSSLAQGPFDTHRSHIDPSKLDSWIAVSADGTVTAYTGKCDFGQGMFTAQTQLVAEELCLSIARVKLIQCDTSVCPDQGTTSGSQSSPTNFNLRNLAQAAATARVALIAMAAKKWNEPADQLKVSEGVITSGSRQITYGELIGGQRFELPLNPDAKRRSPDQWTVLGKAVPSLDRVALVTGHFEFVHNVRVPGMLHGRVVRPPDVGAKVARVDESSVKQIPGFVKVVVRRDFVGVVAEKPWHAVQAARKLKVLWTPGIGLPTEAQYYQTVRAQPSEDDLLVDSRDVAQHLASAVTALKATYFHPYQMHGSIGSSCAVADVRPDAVTVWSATQSAYPTRSIVSKLLNVPLENVRVVYVRGSGCYGLNGADTVSFDAALLSQAVGRPVRVQLSRQDEMAWENYGAACVIEQQAALDEQGAIIAWECESWDASRGGRPGYEKPGNVVTGTLAGFDPDLIQAAAAKEPHGELHNRSNVVPSYLAGCVHGKCGGAGTIRSERVVMHSVNSPFYTGPLRSPLRLQNTFAHECFMDEICARVKADPVEFRLKHLRNERVIGAVKAAANAAGWMPRPGPNANNSGEKPAGGRGIACVAYEGDNGYAALVAEVSVDLNTGRVQLRKFTVAIDAGPISNPDGLRNQTEGGILQGASRALVERVTWDDRRITSVDWETYPSLYLDTDVPEINVVFVERKDVPATGAGETAITLVAAALGNAIFDATGARLREVPFTPERIKAALPVGAGRSA
ncbi:MAG TPA: molybdopterin cofactor-binding domain-containing protein [Candidatus Binatia bacterium]|nr:molybdopterin cofactor-binding domain-containing protein [Candidatus Binatia bacterium]